MLSHEGGGAEQAGFFPVGKESDDIVARWMLARHECAESLEERRATRSVVRGCRPGLHPIVVRHNEHSLSAGVGAANAGRNILNPPRLLIACADACSGLDLRLKAESLEFAGDVIANPAVVGASYRVWALGDYPNVM
jgi:hypothetical protein